MEGRSAAVSKRELPLAATAMIREVRHRGGSVNPGWRVSVAHTPR